MDLFTIELLSNACAQILSDKTISSFADVLPEKLIPEFQKEVAVLEISDPLLYQNVTEAKFISFR